MAKKLKLTGRKLLQQSRFLSKRSNAEPFTDVPGNGLNQRVPMSPPGRHEGAQSTSSSGCPHTKPTLSKDRLGTIKYKPQSINRNHVHTSKIGTRWSLGKLGKTQSLPWGCSARKWVRCHQGQGRLVLGQQLPSQVDYPFILLVGLGKGKRNTNVRHCQA